jgi:hypothetical protein
LAARLPRLLRGHRAISAHDRIQYDNGFFVDGGTDAEHDPAPEQQMLVTLEFIDHGDAATRLKMTTVFGSQAMFEEHTGLGFVEGCNAGLDQLRDLLPSMLQELA